MSILPVVERELRAASKKAWTYRQRWLIAVIVVLFSFPVVLSSVYAAGNRGGGLFFFLSWAAFFLCLGSGIFMTADAISSEKREGTLGLLFLTDLHGYDVVLGKLASTSLRIFYSIMAVMPVMALTLILGGVTAGQFWRVCLSLLLTMLLSLNTGLLVSAFSRDSGHAMGVTFLVLMFLTAATYPLDLLLVFLEMKDPASGPWLYIASPFRLMATALDTRLTGGRTDFLTSLGLLSALTLLALLICSLALPLLWRENKSYRLRRRKTGDPIGLLNRWRQRRRRINAQILDRSPMLWMVGTSRTEGILFTLLILVYYTVIWRAKPGDIYQWIWFPSALVFPYLLNILVASRACRFFVTARRQGFMEMLLSTPLTDRHILQGHWLSIRRTFLAPLIVLCIAVSLPMTDTYFQILDLGFDEQWMTRLFASAYYVLRLGIGFFCVTWAGVYFALTSKRPQFAFFKTFLVAVLLPWLPFYCIPEILITFPLMMSFRGSLENQIRSRISRQLVALSAGDHAGSLAQSPKSTKT